MGDAEASHLRLELVTENVFGLSAGRCPRRCERRSGAKIAMTRQVLSVKFDAHCTVFSLTASASDPPNDDAAVPAPSAAAGVLNMFVHRGAVIMQEVHRPRWRGAEPGHHDAEMASPGEHSDQAAVLPLTGFACRFEGLGRLRWIQGLGFNWPYTPTDPGRLLYGIKKTVVQPERFHQSQVINPVFDPVIPLNLDTTPHSATVEE